LVGNQSLGREGGKESDEENRDRGVDPYVRVVFGKEIGGLVFRNVEHRQQPDLGSHRGREHLDRRVRVNDRVGNARERRRRDVRNYFLFSVSVFVTPDRHLVPLTKSLVKFV